MPKHRRRNVVHVAIAIVLAITCQALAGQEVRFRSITVEGQAFSVLDNHLIIRMRTARSLDAANAVLPQGVRAYEHLLSPLQSTYFQPGRDQFTSTSNDTEVRQVQALELYRAEERLTRTFLVRYEGDRDPLRIMIDVRKVVPDDVEIIEPWYVYRSAVGPNDPGRTEQTYLTTISYDQTWDVFRGSENVTIGISDDGIQQSHEDLTSNIAPNAAEIPDNGIDDDGNGYVDDYRGYNFTWQIDSDLPGNTTSNSSFGHGTKVAGIAAATTNNAIGIAGVGMATRFFPLKTALRNGTGILFGYQSLIYAAQRGLPVVNCSWGLVKPSSAIDQSVIDYCLARNTLVVASAGNHGDDGAGSAFRQRNFPAAYEGVLGVGETTPDDFVVSSSGLGQNARVMAPGNGAYTTDAGGGYTSSGIIGTSFASPIVAGVAGILRARWPDLSARQIAAHICRTADDITSKNNAISAVLSPRVNLYRAVTTEPLSHSFLRLSDVRRRVSSGVPANRFRAGDTIILEFGITNDLAPTTAEVEPKIIDANGWIIRVLSERDALGTVGTGLTVWSRPFACVVEAIGAGPCLMRVDLLSDATIERGWYTIEPPAGIAQFSNDSLIYSMSDDGMVGYTSVEERRQGDGFAKRPAFQLMSPGGFFMIDGSDRSLSAFKNDPPYTSDFRPTKTFDVAPRPEQCSMTDEAAATPVGVLVQQECTFPRPDRAATIWRVRVTPTASMRSIGAGYLLDWDVGTAGRSNTITIDPQLLPAALRGQNNACQTIKRNGYPIVINVAVLSDDPDDVAQSAGFLYASIIDDGDGFTHADRVRLLTSGLQITEAGEGDICGVVGMLHTKPLESGQSWSFRVVVAVGSDEDAARSTLHEALSSVGVSNDPDRPAVPQVEPNPVSDDAVIRDQPNVKRCRVFDALGRQRMVWTHDGSRDVRFSTTTLESGAYSVVLESEVAPQYTTARFVR